MAKLAMSAPISGKNMLAATMVIIIVDELTPDSNVPRVKPAPMMVPQVKTKVMAQR